MLFAMAVLPATARADLFSPGPLAKPHQQLEGLSNCTQCHAKGGDEDHFQEKCLACHKELAPRVAAGTGFHGRLSEDKRDCKTCHSEHQGLDAHLVEWAPSEKSFHHAETGWPLKGKHDGLGCTDCHTRKLVEAKDILSWLDAHPSQKQTFLGLSTSCSACHFDEHRGQLGGRCEKCHVEKGWTTAPGFNHDKTEYPLTGKHRAVTCQKCHEQVADTRTPAAAFPAPVHTDFAKYAAVEHQSCLECHQDPHRGSFGETCANCHSTEGWSLIHNAETLRAFHDKTRYPLRGLHAVVECRSCHGPFPGRPAKFKNLAFASCTACHVDAHEGQLADARTGQTKCEDCHTVTGFLPARFEVADHAKTRYPLEGAHEVTACSACHLEKPSLASRIPPPLLKKLQREHRETRFSLADFHFGGALNQCETCHADPHRGQFRTEGPALACAKCHQVSSFRELKFDHAKDTSFPLTGKHAQAQCAECHRPEQIGTASAVRYRPLAQSCASCHQDVHAGQFRQKGAAQAQDCATCHDTQSFKPAGKFVHTPPFTDFRLDGKHARLECGACHRDVTVSAASKVRRYVGLPTACEGCHQDFHHGGFQQFSQ